MNLKVKAMLATAVFSIGLFVNASPIWAEPQPLTIPSNGIVLQGKAKEKYAADYMKTLPSKRRPDGRWKPLRLTALPWNG